LDLIEQAQKLYNEKKWKEAIDLLGTFIPDTDKNEARAKRIEGWSFYYLGIKGPEAMKIANLVESKRLFEIVLKKGQREEKISAFNGLPLALWILGEQNQAWQVSKQAVEEFPDIPSVWNTKAILCRWGKKFEEALEVNEKVYETALEKGDFRTAGHGKQNQGDALIQLRKTGEAEKEYREATQLYKDYQQISGESAAFHIESVEKKLSKL